MNDPYKTLEVSKDASADDIRKSYRNLAKKLHPDLNPDDAEAEARFKEVAAAYGLLSDPEKRKRFDSGEIDADGMEQPDRQFYRGFADGPHGAKYAEQEGFASDADLRDFMSDLFSGRQQGRAEGGRTFRAKGGDLSYSLEVAFLDAANGAVKTVTMQDGRTLNLTIPAGVRDRQMLRLRGQGLPGYGGGPNGDAYVEIHVPTHPVFTRKDSDVFIDLPISLGEAVLGGSVEAPTITGPVSLTIPKGANSGTRLRLKNKGFPQGEGGERGHQYVTLTIKLPDEIDKDLETFIAEWGPAHEYDPRRTMKSRASS